MREELSEAEFRLPIQGFRMKRASLFLPCALCVLLSAALSAQMSDFQKAKVLAVERWIPVRQKAEPTLRFQATRRCTAWTSS